MSPWVDRCTCRSVSATRAQPSLRDVRATPAVGVGRCWGLGQFGGASPALVVARRVQGPHRGTAGTRNAADRPRGSWRASPATPTPRDMVAHAKDRGFTVTMTTNGSRLGGTPSPASSSTPHLDRIRISLNAGTAETYPQDSRESDPRCVSSHPRKRPYPVSTSHRAGWWTVRDARVRRGVDQLRRARRDGGTRPRRRRRRGTLSAQLSHGRHVGPRALRRAV